MKLEQDETVNDVSEDMTEPKVSSCGMTTKSFGITLGAIVVVCLLCVVVHMAGIL